MGVTSVDLLDGGHKLGRNLASEAPPFFFVERRCIGSYPEFLRDIFEV
jgi:hypothetical protein